MGQVFKARHRTLGRLVAVKILRPALLSNDRAIKRFLREMRVAAGLSHPHIVRALDADCLDNRYFFAMDFVAGQDLAKIVKQTGPLRVAQACDYIRQAALGLQHAHERGMVHRDIKPHNLLVTPAANTSPRSSSTTPVAFLGRWGTVKILDMGLALLTEQEGSENSTQLTQLGVVMGTPDFISPEQVRNSHATDIRSDIYSLGCTLYFLLTARLPFPKGTTTEKLLQHQLDEPPPVEEIRRQQLLQRGKPAREVRRLSPRVAEVVRAMMAKRPEHRLQTPAEVVEAMTALLTPGSAGSLARTDSLREIAAEADTAAKETAEPSADQPQLSEQEATEQPAAATLPLGLFPARTAQPGMFTRLLQMFRGIWGKSGRGTRIKPAVSENTSSDLPAPWEESFPEEVI